MKKAPWILVVGVDGAGKSSHIDDIVAHLKSLGYEVTTTREPGGTELGERIRCDILTTPMDRQTEILLSFAQRAENHQKVVFPALDAGFAVVQDRSTDCTVAYQGFAQGGNLDDIAYLENMVHQGRHPDLVLFFDLPPKESLRRLQGTGKTPDKFESQGEEYFENARKGYLSRVEAFPDRYRVISSLPPLVEVKKTVRETIFDFMKDFKNKPSGFKP